MVNPAVYTPYTTQLKKLLRFMFRQLPIEAIRFVVINNAIQPEIKGYPLICFTKVKAGLNTGFRLYKAVDISYCFFSKSPRLVEQVRGFVGNIVQDRTAALVFFNDIVP
jgi:hypothetical protein